MTSGQLDAQFIRFVGPMVAYGRAIRITDTRYDWFSIFVSQVSVATGQPTLVNVPALAQLLLHFAMSSYPSALPFIPHAKKQARSQVILDHFIFKIYKTIYLN